MGNVRAHTRFNEVKSKQYFWEVQAPSLSAGWWPEYTFIREKSKQALMYRNGDSASARAKARAPASAEGLILPSSGPQQGPKARAFLHLNPGQSWRSRCTFIRDRSSHPLMCRNWGGAFMQGQMHKPQWAVKSRAYLHYEQIHPCFHVQVFQWSSHARAQDLAYFLVELTYIFCHVHRIEDSTACS